MLRIAMFGMLADDRRRQLLCRRAYEFALIVQPPKIKRTTGSAVAPMAIR
jgi:hypothetical protein